MNNDSALFKGNVKLRQAVNYAIDRPQIVRQHGFLGGGRTDQILPPGMPGFKDGKNYPLVGVNNAALTKARALANGNTRGGKAIFYAFSTAPGPAIAQVVQFNLKQIGIDVEIKQFTAPSSTRRSATRGEPFDIGHERLGCGLPGPVQLHQRAAGRPADPGDEQRERVVLQRRRRTTRRWRPPRGCPATARLTAYGNLDNDIMRNQAPLAPYINTNARIFVSQDSAATTSRRSTRRTNLVAVCKK